MRRHPPTYAELAERVRRVAGLLDAITAPGDRVALWALNSDRYLELFIGIPCADRVIVPHNTRWAEPELRYATTDAGAAVLICDRDPGGLADDVGQRDPPGHRRVRRTAGRRAGSRSRRSHPTAWPGSSTRAARPAPPRA